jgi:hypothetical protein
MFWLALGSANDSAYSSLRLTGRKVLGALIEAHLHVWEFVAFARDPYV